VLCSAQASCGDETTSDSEYINNEEYDDDTLTSFVRKTYYITGRHWKTDTMTKNDFFIFNFKEAEMQMVYYRDGEKRDKGATTVKYYTDSTVVFTNDNGEATYTINDDTLKIKISKHAYTAVVLNENDVPEDNDNFHEPSDRTWPDAALEWLEDLWYRWFGDSSDE
jgi:hypothetical protein